MSLIGSVYFLDSEVDPRNVLGLVGVPRVKAERSYWRALCHGRPMDSGPRRNVLVERVLPIGRGEDGIWLATGERMVRPFRGFELRQRRGSGLDMNAWCQGEVLARLERTFEAFFRRCANGGAPGYPRFRSKARCDSLTWQGAGNGGGWSLVDGRLRLQGVGHVKVRWHREIPAEAKIKTVTVKRSAGKWYVCFSLDGVPARPLPRTGSCVGVDLGISTFATLSTGETIEGPRAFRNAQAALRRAQRRVARRQDGSHRQRKARAAVVRHHVHVREVRRDHRHKTARMLVERFDLIAVEDLNVDGLTRGWLAKDVADQGWGQFLATLGDKAEEAGRELVAVDPRGTSQTCSGCGAHVAKALSVRVHSCPSCGFEADRDVNAARNVLRLGRSLQALTQEVSSVV